ncbi:MAG: LVIVD repeat-containing protein, partial [Gemmatimonadales bacterium]
NPITHMDIMKAFRQRSRITAIALALLTACGGDDDGGGPGVDPSPPPPPPAPPPPSLEVVAGGNNVADRYSSDLWVHGGYVYTGTYGGSNQSGNRGDLVNIWALTTSGAPELVDSVKVPSIGTVSDVEVSDDGALLMFSAERDANEGLYVYSLADPRNPTSLDSELVPGGLHTATFSRIGGRLYAFAARNPPDPALMIFDAGDPESLDLVAEVPIPEFYGIHDTYVRDGLAFVFAWDTGVIIYDVGNGLRGGSPASPQEVSRLVTAAGEAPSSAVHNGWWFHNPNTGERRYLFIGQEGPGTIGSRASGDLHVVDVSDLENPREVASLRIAGAGAHNFWMDEEREILYAAFYNAGVVALDVSGTLSGDLTSRVIGRVAPGGAGNTYTWGVHLAAGSLYASDMLSGLWQLRLE